MSRSTGPVVALVDAEIETVTRGRIECGSIVIGNGRIAAVGAKVRVPAGALAPDEAIKEATIPPPGRL
jgi:imidazolonepropionase-like amidohydrolase